MAGRNTESPGKKPFPWPYVLLALGLLLAIYIVGYGLMNASVAP
jgi:hypothetical protein